MNIVQFLLAVVLVYTANSYADGKGALIALAAGAFGYFLHYQHTDRLEVLRQAQELKLRDEKYRQEMKPIYLDDAYLGDPNNHIEIKVNIDAIEMGKFNAILDCYKKQDQIFKDQPDAKLTRGPLDITLFNDSWSHTLLKHYEQTFNSIKDLTDQERQILIRSSRNAARKACQYYVEQYREISQKWSGEYPLVNWLKT